MGERELTDPENIRTCDELVARLDVADDLDSRHRVAAALASKAYTLWESGWDMEAAAVWDEIARRNESATESVMRRAAKRALREEGLILMEMNERRQALRVYRRLAAIFSPNRGRLVHEGLAHGFRALVWFAISIRLQGPVGRLVGKWVRAEQDLLTPSDWPD